LNVEKDRSYLASCVRERRRERVESALGGCAQVEYRAVARGIKKLK